MSLIEFINKCFGAKNFKNIFLIYIIMFTIIFDYNKIKSLKTEDFLHEVDLNKELYSRMNYYNSLISDLKLSNHLYIEIKDNQLSLKANRDFPGFSKFWYLPKYFTITSCDLFPFKEDLLQTFNKISTSSKLDIMKFSSNIIMTYYIMYLKFGEHDKIKQYYIDSLKDLQEKQEEILNILPFEIHHELKLYLNNLPTQNTRSVFFFNKEENELAKSLGIELMSKVIFENIHQKIIEDIKKNFPENGRMILLNFIDRPEFNSILTFVNSSEFYMDEIVFSTTFISNEKMIYYQESKQHFLTNNSPLNSICKFITPLLDLVEIKPRKELDKSDMVYVSIDKVSEHPNYVVFGFNRKFSNGEIFFHTPTELLQTEILFSITGKVLRNNPNDFFIFLYALKREDFSKEAINLCLKFGCGGFNLGYILNLPSNQSKIPFYLNKHSINYDFLKISKLKYVNNFDYYVEQNFMTDQFIDFTSELKADSDYLNTLSIEINSQPDYEKLIQDYLKLKGIYKGMYNFNQGNLIKTFSGLENKINLVQIALIKGEILKIQEDLILKKMIKDTQEDLKRLKRDYLN